MGASDFGAHLQIEFLGNRPDALECVADWLHGEWFRDMGSSPAATLAAIRGRMNVSATPFSLIALADSEPVGTVSLVEEEGTGERSSIHCLSGLFVRPDFRNRGIGAALCRRIADEAKQRATALALYTESAVGFFERLGWHQSHDMVIVHGEGLRLVTYMTLVR